MVVTVGVTELVLQTIRSLKCWSWLKDFLAFGYLEARACIFAGSFFGLLFVSTRVDVPGLHRYDLILIGALLIQFVLVKSKIESYDELKMIFLFHLIGLALELYKTHPSVGSWSYPEEGLTKVYGVPLYSGFMYSAVGSYISQAWRLLNLQLVNYPNRLITILLSGLIYLNFFTNHFMYDFRWWLLVAVVIVFYRSWILFTPLEKTYRMPAWVSFGLISFFVWIAENISTLFGAWQYPDQALGWSVVKWHKIVSWFLLVIICFVIVVDLKYFKAKRNPEAENGS